jgi:hypothetical protein
VQTRGSLPRRLRIDCEDGMNAFKISAAVCWMRASDWPKIPYRCVQLNVIARRSAGIQSDSAPTWIVS